MKKTNVLRILDKAKISYQIFEYDYDPEHGSAKAVAAEKGITSQLIYKTLVGKGNQTGIIVAVIPIDDTLNFKALCKVAGNKKMILVPVKDLQGLTGYVRGGCSPMGIKKPYPVFLDQSMFDLELIYVNAGQRGILVGLSPNDLMKITDAAAADLAVKASE